MCKHTLTSRIPKLPLWCDTDLSSVNTSGHIAPVHYRNICKKVDGSSSNRQHTFNKGRVREIMWNMMSCRRVRWRYRQSSGTIQTLNHLRCILQLMWGRRSSWWECWRERGWPVWTPHLGRTRASLWAEMWQSVAALHAGSLTHVLQITHNALLVPHVMSLRKIPSYGCESVSGTSGSTFCSLSNPARTTLMTSAVKTKCVRISSSSSSSAAPCPAARPWRPALVRRRGVAGVEFGGWGVCGEGESRCLVLKEAK